MTARPHTQKKSRSDSDPTPHRRVREAELLGLGRCLKCEACPHCLVLQQLRRRDTLPHERDPVTALEAPSLSVGHAPTQAPALRCSAYRDHQTRHRWRLDGWGCEACDPRPDTGPPCPKCGRPMAATATLGYQCPDGVIVTTHGRK